MKITDTLYISFEEIIAVNVDKQNGKLHILFSANQTLPFVLDKPEEIKSFLEKYDRYLHEEVKIEFDTEPHCHHPRYQFDISKIKGDKNSSTIY